jgi:hypothetical protein
VYLLNREYQTPEWHDSTFILRDSIDSFGDGSSSLTTNLSRFTASGEYIIGSVYVADKAGNGTGYNRTQLRPVGIHKAERP